MCPFILSSDHFPSFVLHFVVFSSLALVDLFSSLSQIVIYDCLCNIHFNAQFLIDCLTQRSASGKRLAFRQEIQLCYLYKYHCDWTRLQILHRSVEESEKEYLWFPSSSFFFFFSRKISPITSFHHKFVTHFLNYSCFISSFSYSFLIFSLCSLRINYHGKRQPLCIDWCSTEFMSRCLCQLTISCLIVYCSIDRKKTLKH